jgi:putative aldouronate transport system permease protein
LTTSVKEGKPHNSLYKKRLRKRFSVFDAFNVALFIVLNIIMLFPFWSVLTTSLSTSAEAMSKTFILWPQSFNLHSYEYILSTKRIPYSFFITVASTVCGTIWCMFLSTTVAYGLSKKYLVGRNFFIWLITLTMFLDGGLIPSYLLITRTLHLQNTFWVLFITGGFSVITFMMLKAFFNQIPEELEESAKIDGAHDITVFIRVILPLSLPAIATFSLFYAVGLWNQYFIPMLFTNSRPDLHPLQLVLRKIIVENNKEFDLEMLKKYGTVSVYEDGVKYAAVMVATMPILAVYPFIQKYFNKGILLGSVKG